MTDSRKLIGFLVAAAAAGALAAVGLGIAVPPFDSVYAAAIKKLDAQAAAMGLIQSTTGTTSQSSPASDPGSPQSVYDKVKGVYRMLMQPNGRAEIGEARLKSVCDQIIQASKFTPSPGSRDIGFVSFANAKACVKILAADAEAQAKRGNHARCAAELEAINRISTQTLSDSGLIGQMVSAAIRGIEVRTIGQVLALHPDKSWASTMLEVTHQMKEPALLAAMPDEYASIRPTINEVSRASNKELLLPGVPDDLKETILLQRPDSPLSRQVAYIILQGVIQNAQTVGWQFCSQAPPAAKAAPIGDPDTWKTASAIWVGYDIRQAVLVEKKLRVRLSVLEEAAVCLENQGSSKPMPYPLPEPVFVPDRQPMTQVSQAKPRRTVSLTDPFTQKPIIVKRIPGGFVVAAEVSPDAATLQRGDASPYLGPGKTGSAIVYKNGKLQLINI